MAYHLEFAEWIPVPLPRVFAFFANPENLPLLMAPTTQTKVDGFLLVPPPPSPDGDAKVSREVAGTGSVIDTSFRPLRYLSWRRKWTAAITEFEWNHHFADVQQKGPFKRWHHRHEFVADRRDGFDGTLVRDVIEYEIGYRPFGTLLNTLFIERRIRQIFAYLQKRLPELLT